MFKILHDKPDKPIDDHALDNPLWKGMTIGDIKAMEDLMELWEEGGLDETDFLKAEDLWSAPNPPPTPIFSSSLNYFKTQGL